MESATEKERKKGPIKGIQQEELGSVRLMMFLIHPEVPWW